MGFSESKVVSLRSARLDYSGDPLGLKLDKAEVRPQIADFRRFLKSTGG